LFFFLPSRLSRMTLMLLAVITQVTTVTHSFQVRFNRAFLAGLFETLANIAFSVKMCDRQNNLAACPHCRLAVALDTSARAGIGAM
jgi:hypothetical protein